MKPLLLVIVLLLLACIASAQICPDTPGGYQRQPRPAGQPANYPPPGEPVCYMRDTVTAANIPSCNCCHIPWRSAWPIA